MSYKSEVIADNSGEWCGNALRFATRTEAEIYVDDLMMRWTAVRDTRVVESDDPVNYRLDNGRLACLDDPGDAEVCRVCGGSYDNDGVCNSCAADRDLTTVQDEEGNNL